MALSNRSTSLPPEYRELIDLIQIDERKKVELILKKAIDATSKEIQIIDLWEQPELAVTNWILLLTGVNQEEEIEIANTLLMWKAFFAKDSARVLCVQSSEHEYFRCCCLKFGAVNCPTLILGDSTEMNNFIKIESQLLFTLHGNKGGLQRFFTNIHTAIQSGSTLKDIEKDLRSERFWSGLKMVYNEIRGLMTLNISAKADVG